MLQSWDKLLSTSTLTELQRDCGITVRSRGKWFCPMSNKNTGLCLQDWTWVKQNCSSKCFMKSGLLYNPTMKQTNLRTGCKSALQPGTMTGRRSETFYDIFSLPRISTKDFPYIKGKIDRSIGINYSSVNFKWTQVFLCCQSFDRRGQWIF